MAEPQRLLDWWLAPPGAGEPVACLATSFTFDTDFFRDECLARFLGLRSAVGEEASSSAAQINELEERLSAVTAAAIVDRSATPDARNLRWDLLPVTYEHGLLHAKTTLLLWQDAARVIIGSANLTSAGYRYQREIAMAFDLVAETPVPRSFWNDYAEEFERILELVPADTTTPGPKARAVSVLAKFRERIQEVDPTNDTPGNRILLVPSRPGEPALDHLKGAMKGAKPRWLAAMSPFWDAEDAGKADAVRALTGLLAATGPAEARLLVPLQASPAGNLIQAPLDLEQRSFRSGIETSIWGVGDGSDQERRRLHAKALLIESDDWVTLMVGSSNMTASGLGLNAGVGHIEMNVAYGAPQGSKLAKQLLAVLPESQEIDATRDTFDESPSEDEDAPTRPALPAAFLSATLVCEQSTWKILLSFDQSQLPRTWRVIAPSLQLVLADSDTFTGEPLSTVNIESDGALPQSLTVAWMDANGESAQADWIINVADPAQLPLDERLRSIPVDLIIQALAHRSGNPSLLIEQLLDRLAGLDSEPESTDSAWYLDPLKRFDDSRALLRRMNVYGRALDQLALHLSRPVPTASALGWRLTGLISPARLASGWADQCTNGDLPLELTHFLFAELQLTVGRIKWSQVTEGLDPKAVDSCLAAMQTQIDEAFAQLPSLSTGSLLSTYLLESRGFDGPQ